jgi:type VI secretion system secreted protein VgrG
MSDAPFASGRGASGRGASGRGVSSPEFATNAWVEVDFSPDPGYRLLFDGLHGHEELGRPFLYELDLSSGMLHADIDRIVGATAIIWLAESASDADRFFNGIVTRVVSSGLAGGAYRYRLEVRPWIWLLTRQTDCRIFQSRSAFQIIAQVFRDAGFADFEDQRQSDAGDAVLEYCVQYRESSFDFVSRLMEQYGLYYFFRHAREQHVLVIADDPNAHETLPDEIPFVFDQTEFRTVDDHIWQWSTERTLQSGRFTARDYNFTIPSADLTARSRHNDRNQHGNFEVYEYPGPYDEASLGHRLTDIRMQAIAMRRVTVEAVSNARLLHPGWRFRLTQHPEQPVNRDYLITGAEFTLSAAAGSSAVDGEMLDTYRVTLRAIPGDVPYRLERATPRPLIRGPQTARVAGPGGDEITTDEYGRVKVKFHWDRSEVRDDQRTCWIRVAQSAIGTIFIPRVGQEVVVEFLEGNPDRPLITGLVYNANLAVPYALPGHKTRSAIKTSSSRGGNGFNELRFDDDAGGEEVSLHAQKDFNTVVLGDETVKIHGNATTTVETGDRTVTVSKGADSLTVSLGDHTITVSAGKSGITAMQSITLSVGANSLRIDQSGVTINGTMVSVTAGTIALN